jgi:hypothetical protein
VPALYQDLYWRLAVGIVGFQRTITVPDGASTTFSLELTVANANRGTALLDPNMPTAVALQLDRFVELGAKAVTIDIGFPLLSPAYAGPYLDAYLDRYRLVAAAARARGLQLIVKCGVLIASEDVQRFYDQIDTYEAYRNGRLEVAALVARTLEPDFLTLQAEPDVEAWQTGQPVGSPAEAAQFVASLAAGLQAARSPATAIGAGAGTWYEGFEELLAAHAGIAGLDYLDIHIYPINRDWLPRAAAAADIARSGGKRVGVSEAWLFKVRDGELLWTAAMLPQILARDSYSFWQPLDIGFLTTLARLAAADDFLFVSPFWSKYLYGTLDYASVGELPPSEAFEMTEELAVRNLQAGILTLTGLAYRQLARQYGSPP